MPNTHCGKHNKLSKTMGSPLDSMEEIISSQCPYNSEWYFIKIFEKKNVTFENKISRRQKHAQLSSMQRGYAPPGHPLDGMLPLEL